MTDHRREQRRRYDRARQGDEARKWYRTKAWAIRRRDQLAAHPMCCLCEAEGVIRYKERMIVDHHPRHNGDYLQFFTGPVRTLCKHHHDTQAQADEARGFSVQIGADGWPEDEQHAFNTQGARPKPRKTR